VDVGAQAQIWDALRAARADGLAVLLISADLDELIGLSDTIEVILRGRLVATADPRTVTPEELGSAMTGAGAGGPGPGATAGRHGLTDETEARADDRPGAPGTGLTGTGTTGTGSLSSGPGVRPDKGEV
jgi:simple sugar transport system ATP-binding protein